MNAACVRRGSLFRQACRASVRNAEKICRDWSMVDAASVATGGSEVAKRALTYAPIRDKFERAFRNEERLHLDFNQVRALVASPVYATLANLSAKEFADQCQDEETEEAATPRIASNSGHSGFGTGPIATTGASVGTMTEAQAESVGRAASQRASAAVKAVVRPRRQKTH